MENNSCQYQDLPFMWVPKFQSDHRVTLNTAVLVILVSVLCLTQWVAVC